MTADILYPVAYAADGQLMHITMAAKGTVAYCFGCDAAMVPHQGPQRQWHFHHRVQNRCDPDRALHRAAVVAVTEGIDSAIRTGRPYLLKRSCLRCGQLIEQDIATPGATVEAEKMLLRRDDIDLKRRTLPDVAFYAADGTTTVVKVVVTHDLEDKTREAYEQAAIPVYRVYPDWQTLPELQHAFSARDALNMPSPWCTDCRQRAQQAAKQQAEQAREQQAKLAERDLMARSVPESVHTRAPTRGTVDAGICMDLEPGDCIIGTFTGVDMPGSRITYRPGLAPRWKFEDPATGVGICVPVWPNKLRADKYGHLVGQACILTCWQEGTSMTGNRNFRVQAQCYAASRNIKLSCYHPTGGRNDSGGRAYRGRQSRSSPIGRPTSRRSPSTALL